MIKKRIRHIKRGTTYEVLHHATLQVSTDPVKDGDLLWIYATPSGVHWYARPVAEFTPDRFEELPDQEDGVPPEIHSQVSV